MIMSHGGIAAGPEEENVWGSLWFAPRPRTLVEEFDFMHSSESAVCSLLQERAVNSQTANSCAALQQQK